MSEDLIRSDIEAQITRRTAWLAEQKEKAAAAEAGSVEYHVASGMALYHEGYLEALWSIAPYVGIERHFPERKEGA